MEPNETKTTDYKVMMDMLNEAKEQYQMFKDLLQNGYLEDDISLTRTEFLFNAYSVEDIESMDDEISKEMLEKIRIPFKENEEKPSMDEWVRTLCNNYYEGVIRTDDMEDEFESYYEKNYGSMIRSILVQMKKDVSSLEKSKEDIDKLEKESNDVMEEYMNYMCSTEYEERRKEKIEELKEKLKSCEDENASSIKKMLRDVEKAYDLSFLTERLEKEPKKEAMNIVNTFFDSKRSIYIMDRCKEKLSKIGFNKEVYRFFFNIEENYLPEKYHVYNNLFLFHVMRYISYININSKSDRSFVRSIISSISKLIYEKYNDEQRAAFIEKIENILSYFEDYHDKFERDNFLHPNHPRRLEKDREHEQEEREMMIKTLLINKVNDMTEEEYRELPINELKEIYKEKLKEVEEKEKKDKVKDLEDFIVKTKPSGVESEEINAES